MWMRIEKGYELTFARADDASLSLVEFGEYLFDSLILFAPQTSRLGGGVGVDDIMEFVRSGRSVVLAGSSDMGEPMRELAAECGIEFDEQDSYVLDHVGYDASDADGDHSLLVADAFGDDAKVVVGAAGVAAPVLFRGIGHAILASGEDDDGVHLEVLVGSDFAYSHVPSSPVEEIPLTVGSTTGLVSAVQARNNARLAITGSLEMFSNAFLQASVARASGTVKPVKSGNKDFVLGLTSWVFGERNLLRIAETAHFKADDASKSPLGTYRVKDDIEFHAVIQEWDGSAWIPYQTDDIQLEFQMLDPYVRLTMPHDGAGNYVAAFKVPDVYGVFQFKLNYRRHGYSSLSLAEQVSIRPFRHNEFPRMLVQAYPYYVSAFSSLGCFVLFSFVFLHHRE